MESEDYAFYQGLVYLMDNMVEHLGYDLSFSTEVCSFCSYIFPCHISFATCLLCTMHDCDGLATAFVFVTTSPFTKESDVDDDDDDDDDD